jgi:hypothetical protein
VSYGLLSAAVIRKFRTTAFGPQLALLEDVSDVLADGPNVLLEQVGHCSQKTPDSGQSLIASSARTPERMLVNHVAMLMTAAAANDTPIITSRPVPIGIRRS